MYSGRKYKYLKINLLKYNYNELIMKYFHFLLLFAATPLQFRGKYCTFHYHYIY